MWLILNMLVTLALGAMAYRWLDVARIFDVLQPIIVCLSIMAAAVFVRLNRGMPTLDWKSLSTEERKQLTSSIVHLTNHYVQIVALNGLTLIGIITLAAVGKVDIQASACTYQQWVAAALAFLLSQCVLRMAYVVWRDYDIVRLQKVLLDKAADRDAAEANKKTSDETVAAIRSSNLRSNTMPKVGGG